MDGSSAKEPGISVSEQESGSKLRFERMEEMNNEEFTVVCM